MSSRFDTLAAGRHSWRKRDPREEVENVGRFYDLIQQHIDEQPYGVSEAQIARRLGVTQTTLSNWQTPKRLIAKKHVIAVAKLTGVRYERARDALLEDIGWLHEDSPEPGASQSKAGESA